MRWHAPATGFVALTVLAALLPFELQQPLLALGPLAITNVEMVLYPVLLLWFAGRAIQGARELWWTSAHTAVLAWAGVLSISAVFAPGERDEAVKFALRSLGGCALFFAAADLVRTPAQASTVLVAVAGGAVLSALAGLAEVALPEAAEALLAFKQQATRVGGFMRAGGSFQYANIAAMYWESALPILLGLAGWWTARGAAGRRLAGFLGAVVLAGAIVLSASRGALFAAAVALAFLAWLGLRRVPALRLPAVAGLLTLAALTSLTAAIDPWRALRFRSAGSDVWHSATYDSGPAPLEMTAGETVVLRVTVRNDGLMTWYAAGDQSISLSYHWYDPRARRTVLFEGKRTALPDDVPAGAEVTLAARVLAPPWAGSYMLQWDMVQENSFWFSAHGIATGNVAVRLHPSAAGATAATGAPIAPQSVIPRRPSRSELWSTALRMWRERPLLGIGPDAFRHRYGAYLGIDGFDDRIHANNLYIEVLATMGLAGALALLALMAALWRTARRAWSATSDPAARALLGGLFAGLLVFFVHGIVDYFFEFTATYGLFWLLAGATAGLGSGAERAR